MLAATSPIEQSAAIRVDLGAIFLSMELSRATWLITSLSPGTGEGLDTSDRFADSDVKADLGHDQQPENVPAPQRCRPS